MAKSRIHELMLTFGITCYIVFLLSFNNGYFDIDGNTKELDIKLFSFPKMAGELGPKPGILLLGSTTKTSDSVAQRPVA